MPETVFSHIVRKRLSPSYEDVATDALEYLLDSSEATRNSMMEIICKLVADMPSLQFATQQSFGNMRIDMVGYDGDEARVFIENKFWAGLTDQQPAQYLEELAKCTKTTVLLMVVPKDREQSILRELARRLSIPTTDFISASDPVIHFVKTDIGPILAVTSWRVLLEAFSQAVADNESENNDILQLASLCDAADSEVFLPPSSEAITDQRIPQFILQLRSIVENTIDQAETGGILSRKGVRPQADFERMGRYARFSDEYGVGIWFGIHFRLWKKHGGTPLWLVFSVTSFGRSREVRKLMEPWATQNGISAVSENEDFVVPIHITPGEEKDVVINGIIKRLKEIAEVLSSLAPKL